MIEVESKTLEEAYLEAAEKLQCSIKEISFNIVKHGRKGFLGIGSDNFIVEAKKLNIETTTQTKDKPKTKKQLIINKTKAKTKKQSKIVFDDNELKPLSENFEKISSFEDRHKDIFENFNKESISMALVLDEIKDGVEKLFALSDFVLYVDEVSLHNDNTIYIKVDGADAALLIGKEGYRYNALLTMLSTWVHSKYGVRLRLEIAKFLSNQEDMMRNFLTPLISKIEQVGEGVTKPLDGILIQIACEQLREAFPDKYVCIRSKGDEQFVTINENRNICANTN